MLLKKSNVWTVCYDRFRADDGSDDLAADDSLRPGDPGQPRKIGAKANSHLAP
jgi:hypothetical protein